MAFVPMIWPQTKAVADVPDQAVAGHRGIGWVPLDEWREPTPEPAVTDTPATDAESATTKPSRRRGADTPQEQ